MPYAAEISRTNPTCFLFLIDQSRSMNGPMGGAPDKTKADGVAESINRLLYTLVLRCVWGQQVLDRFHVGVIGYGRQVVSGLSGALTGRDLVPVSDLARSPLRVESRSQAVDDGFGGIQQQIVRAPVWFEPAADGKTPMVAALDQAALLLGGFLAEHPACYPPLVINLSDGEATDGNPEVPAARIRQLSGDDGFCLLFNVHLSSQPSHPIEFPDSEAGLPTDGAKRLFRMSSPLPPPMHTPARQAGLMVNAATRGFVFNADLASVIRFLDIGTRVDLKNSLR
jgi:hypothetical protein